MRKIIGTQVKQHWMSHIVSYVYLITVLYKLKLSSKASQIDVTCN